MRREGRRKPSKRKSFEAEKRTRLRSNSNSDAPNHENDSKIEEIDPAAESKGIQVVASPPTHPPPRENGLCDELHHSQTTSSGLCGSDTNSLQGDDEILEDETGSVKNSELDETETSHVDMETKKDKEKSDNENKKQNGEAPLTTCDEDQDEKCGSDKEDDVQSKQLSNAANEAAIRFFSSMNLNPLMLQALLNLKQEPFQQDNPLAGEYMQRFLSTVSGGHNGTEYATPRENQRASKDNFAVPSTSLLRPLAEQLSPDAFAKQLRRNESASMVVCRSTPVKNMNATPDSNVPAKTNSGTAQTGSVPGLHQFVTRYTIERPEDPARSGIEVCLEGDDLSDPVIEVECGGNKGLLYVSKLCQGSKGQSIFFNDEWLTPNEFQFISGRETAKDWKRSIRHCGKSLKTLMTKGILQVHLPVCECDYCKGHLPSNADKMMKKRGNIPPQDRLNSVQDATRSGGSTTPSSTESITPLSTGFSDASNVAQQRSGREGGLNSIISQLQKKKGITGNDGVCGHEEESLNLTVRAPSNCSIGSINGRKRQRESGQKHGTGNKDDFQLPVKRHYSNEEGSNRSMTQHFSEPLCLSSEKSSQGEKQGKVRYRSTSSSKSDWKTSSHDYNGVHDLNRDDRYHDNRTGRKSDQSPSPIPRPFPDYFGRGYRPDYGCNDHSFLDVMKRAVANSNGSFPERSRSPPPPTMLPHRFPSSGSSLTRGGFINLDSTSRRYDAGSSQVSPYKDQPMVELTSQHRKMSDPKCYDQYRYERQRSHFEARPAAPHKAPVTVLHHHPRQYDASPSLGHRQSASSTPNTHHYYAMPPPIPYSHDLERRSNSRPNIDRMRRSIPCYPPRFDKKGRQVKNGPKRSAQSDTARRSNEELDLRTCRDQRMVDLQNYAIPMLSLTYSKKKRSSEFDGKINDDCSTRPCDEPSNTDASLTSFSGENLKGNSRRMAASDDEISRKGDIMRRISSSAPPPLNGSPTGNSQSIHKSEFNEDAKREGTKDEVFQSNRPRAKSASPNAPRSHPYFDGTRHPRSSSSIDLVRPDSIASYQDSPFDNAPSLHQQYEMMRWNDLSSAIEDMGNWSVEKVCEFLRNIGCNQYEEIFRENGIDGDALPLLMEHHLVNKMGMKLGHALKVIARVHRRLGNHCALLTDRFLFSRASYPMFSIATSENNVFNTGNTPGNANVDNSENDHGSN